MSAAVAGVLAQRLVRRICPSCKVAYLPDIEVLEQLNLAEEECQQLYYGKTCQDCAYTGYKGRVGLFELLLINDEIRELITMNASTLSIRNKAIAQGMITLRNDGVRALTSGLTTVDEILRYT